MDPVLAGLAPGSGWRLALILVIVALAMAMLFWSGLRRRSDLMGWAGHVDELRRRIITSLATVLVLTALLFSFRWPPGAPWPAPALHDNLASQAFHRIAADLVPVGVQLVVVRPIDGFLAEMTVAFGLATIMASPVLVGQAAGFILPALRPEERRGLRNLIAPVTLLFLLGAAFAYLYVLPFLLRTLYSYGDALGAQPLLQVSELIGFTVGIVLVMGAAFQTPVVMYGLTRAGLVEAALWARGWRHAIIAILVLSAVVTDPTVVSQLVVAAPLLLLYGIGIVAARLATPTSR